MKYHITHKTCYTYSDVASVCHNLIHLAPRAARCQRPHSYRLKVDPDPAFLLHHDDYFGNRTEYFSIEAAHRKLEINAESIIEVAPTAVEVDQKSSSWESCVPTWRGFGEEPAGADLSEPIPFQLTFSSPRVPLIAALRQYAERSFRPRRPIVEAIVELSSRIFRDFQFDPRATTVDTPLADVLRLRRGVCQDFAHLATGCLRSMGLAARYTSGYLRTDPPPGKPRLIGADASHAWASCWCGPLGWIDFDPTNNCLAGDSHVTIAWGRDYGDVCPIQGVFIGAGEHRIGVSVTVMPLEGG